MIKVFPLCLYWLLNILGTCCTTFFGNRCACAYSLTTFNKVLLDPFCWKLTSTAALIVKKTIAVVSVKDYTSISGVMLQDPFKPAPALQIFISIIILHISNPILWENVTILQSGDFMKKYARRFSWGSRQVVRKCTTVPIRRSVK